MTTTYFDFSDVYIETLSESGEGVMFNGEEVPFIKVTDQLVLTDTPEGVSAERLYVPHHGPVLSIDREAGVAVTLRWTAQDADTDVNFLLELPLAQSVEQAREALKNLTTIGQNVVVADTEGHIGWFPYNRLPTRPWMSAELNPSFPLPGEGRAEWGAPIPYEELPQAFDPALGLLATANHDMTGAFSDGDPTNDGQQAVQEDPAKGYRYSQIMRLLDRPEPHTRDSLSSIIHDHESLLGRRLLPELLRLIEPEGVTEAGAPLFSALQGWAYDCPAGVSLDADQTPVGDELTRAESRGCLAFHATLGQLIRLTFRDELREAGLESGDAYIESLARLLGRPEAMSQLTYWDNVSTEGEQERPGQLIAWAINQAASELRQRLGEDPEGWLWGRAHTVTLAANLLNDAGISSFNHGPFPNHGGLYTVDVANPRDVIGGDFTHGAGASMRFVCELDGYPQCSFEVPGGQRHFRDQPHYEDLFQLWLAREQTPMRFEELEIEASTVERWSFNP
jgi:penicillin amidase